MRRDFKKLFLYGILLFLTPILFLFISVLFNWFGSYEGVGEVIKDSKINKQISQELDTKESSLFSQKQILFGDLHVHTTLSLDAFVLNLPIANGEGVHPVADACNFARFCSNLDFFAVTDHAEWLTPREWKDSLKSIQQCSNVSNQDDDLNIIPFLGWEWTQTSIKRNEHYGHKNIIIKNIVEEKVPPRPIAADSGQFDRYIDVSPLLISGAIALDFPNRANYFNWRYRSLVASSLEDCKNKRFISASSECLEKAKTPFELYRKLSKWNVETMVIPHGTSWGQTAPPLAAWDYQLNPKDHNQSYSKLIEIYSGHGNSEEFRAWSPFNFKEGGELACGQPSQNYLPDCHQAGEVIKERCRVAAGNPEECNKRASQARQIFTESEPFGLLTVPGYDPEEWKDSGQCRDCFLPAFDYRPKMSAQYALALTDFSNAIPTRYRFGFIGSSDNHQARPGNGYKENLRFLNTESRIDLNDKNSRNFINPRLSEPKLPSSKRINMKEMSDVFLPIQAERGSSLLYTGGLVAVHTKERTRNSLWSAMETREVYATSGERILLWFDLINHPIELKPMGTEVEMGLNPVFRVRAIGSQKQLPGCDLNLRPDQIKIKERICQGECFNPSDERKNISRIEIVRIRPQVYEGEPINSLIEDPWKSFTCETSQQGCEVEFIDEQFIGGNREVVYYVRAIQEASQAINGAGLNCKIDENGNCLQVKLCGDAEDITEGCLSLIEERAWSSPIFVKHKSDFP